MAAKKIVKKKPVRKKPVTKKQPASGSRFKYFSPQWQSISGFGGSSDAWGGQPQPSVMDLIIATTDVVYACVQLIKNNLADTPIRLYTKGNRPGRYKAAKLDELHQARLRQKGLPFSAVAQEVLDHEILDLLHTCNSTHNQSDFIGLVSESLDVTGDAYVLCEDNVAGQPTELYFLKPQAVQVIRDSDFRVVEYRYGQGVTTYSYKPEQIIHFRNVNLQDPYVTGLSPLRAVWQRVNVNFLATSFMQNVLSNNARPDSIIAISESLYPDEAERVMQEFYQRMGQAGSGGPLFLDGKMNYTPLQFSPRDMSELQIHEVVKTAVCNAYQVPPDALEKGTSSNRATRESALYSLMKDSVKPRLSRIVGRLNQNLLPRFHDPDLFLLADEVIPEDQDRKIQVEDMLLKNGVMLRSESRRNYNLPPQTWAEIPLLPNAQVPAPVTTGGDVELSDDTPVIPPTQEELNSRSNAVQGLQKDYFSGAMDKDSCIANAVLCLGFGKTQAELLFPDKPPVPETPVTDLRDTSQGSAGVLALQQAYFAKQLPREAALANAVLLYGFTPEESGKLFPEVQVAQPQAEAGQPEAGETDNPNQAEAVQEDSSGGSDLRATVGGSTAVGDLQRSYYSREISREACMSNARLIFGFTQEEAEELFPEVPPDAPQPPAVVQPPQAPPPTPGPQGEEVPDVRQRKAYDCGLAAVKAVLQHFDLGDVTEEELGTTEANGTSPEQIVACLTAKGLTAMPHDNMTLADLDEAIDSARLVIAAVQAGSHWVVVDDINQHDVHLHDPVHGPTEVSRQEFEKAWWDSEVTKAAGDDCVSRKVRILMDEGKSQDQAVAIAIHMCKEEKSLDQRFGIVVGKPDQSEDNPKGPALPPPANPKPLEAQLKKFFKRQGQAAMKKVSSRKGVSKAASPFDLGEWTREMYRQMQPVMEVLWNQEAKETLTRLGLLADLHVVQPKLKEGMEKATYAFCRETNETTSQELSEAYKQLKEQLAEGVTEGEVKAQLMRRTQEVFDAAENERAFKIAITEASRGQHAARFLAAAESDVVVGKKWILSDDACPKCLPLADKVVALDEPFATIGEGPYGTIDHPPYHPACRCVAIQTTE